MIAPHMDDCVLGCGGTIALLPDKNRIFLVYATDGSRSPAPTRKLQPRQQPDLVAIRSEEARQALATLGVPADNLRFLGLPDGRLAEHKLALHAKLGSVLSEIQPVSVLAPFRFDRHPDHLAVNQVATNLLAETAVTAQLLEYFVYFKWQLLPGKDLRRYVDPTGLVAINISGAALLKRQALDCFRSQTTRYYSWQTRPVLTPQFLDQVIQSPEYFLKYDPALPGGAVITRARAWVQTAHYLEPMLKSLKDRWLGRVSPPKQGHAA